MTVTCEASHYNLPQEIYSRLDRIIKALSSDKNLSPSAAIEQLCFLLFLKLLDEEETRPALSSQNLVLRYPGQTERFRWSRWCRKHSADLLDFIRDDVFPYMGSLVREDPQVAEYFRDAALEISDTAVLKQVVDELSGIDLQACGSAITGSLFGYLLSRLGQSPSEGQFHTPQLIRDIMVTMVSPEPGDTINDPTCGTGGLLVDAMKYIQNICPNKTSLQSNQESAIFGADISLRMARIATMNLMLHGIDNPRITRANTLSAAGGLSENELNRKYSVVLCDPPLGGISAPEPIRRELSTSTRKSELLFTHLVMESLAPGGRAAMIIPEGLLFASTTAHVELRKKLVEEFELLAVISLPVGAFKPLAAIKTDVVVLRRPLDGQVQKVGRTLFYEISDSAFAPAKKTGGNSTAINDIPDLLNFWKEYRESGFVNTSEHQANSLSESGKYWWAARDTIAANGYNLVARSYFPQPKEETSEESPAELIRELLIMEREITYGLERLLKEIESP